MTFCHTHKMTYFLHCILSCSTYTPTPTPCVLSTCPHQVTNKGSFTCFINSDTSCRPTLQKCDLIKDIPSLLYERKRLVHF